MRWQRWHGPCVVSSHQYANEEHQMFGLGIIGTIILIIIVLWLLGVIG